jgi:sec-independent protein translocase protein TatA
MEGLLQPTHLLLILGIALLMFGPRELPELGQGLGKGIRGSEMRYEGSGKTRGHESPMDRRQTRMRHRHPLGRNATSRQRLLCPE